jgi:hypothetical protein
LPYKSDESCELIKSSPPSYGWRRAALPLELKDDARELEAVVNVASSDDGDLLLLGLCPLSSSLSVRPNRVSSLQEMR